ncbi:NmrA-like protein [Rhodopseudomonas palustris HaA2]|uniref:NmrA-like protein n=1 Tax=Rhodopseudomonas palustris (strain HaA2) TaxID=316058 RepID=Q2IWU0_RHOP2|nr:SDR family oxidoreductase [Rhodopseudomonas palustris]ABD07320.1 NmrA-like protein [Rhodopseudomonas palustris HaA2]
MSSPRFLVTGANGQLGRRVIDTLLGTISAPQISALVRGADAAAALSARGIQAHVGDYGRPETLAPALAGVDRVLLISSSEIGRRTPQHRNVIAAAREAGVQFLAYTSLLHADISPLGLAEEHRQTEAALRESGVPFALLRNGWYTENYAASIPAALAHSALLGSAGDGRISSASRADYAAAAAAVLTADTPAANQVYELAGDEAYTLTEFAAEIARQSGKAVAYRDLPEADYKAALLGAGLPEPFAALLADSDAGAAKDALFDDSRTLSRLIGRPTTPYAETIGDTLKASRPER